MFILHFVISSDLSQNFEKILTFRFFRGRALAYIKKRLNCLFSNLVIHQEISQDLEDLKKIHVKISDFEGTHV